MTQIDNDNNGIPDGIINLYDEYLNLGNTIQAGSWFDPGFNFALNETTGDLYLWDLDNSSETLTDYQFQLTNANCGSEIALTLNVVVGPFEGVPLPPSVPNSANVTICEAGVESFDLFQVFESLPSPHKNGVWAFIGNIGDPENFLGLSEEGTFQAKIPYEPGGDLIEFDVFEFSYTVPGISPCSTSSSINFKVEVIRDVFSGNGGGVNVCETDLIAGLYDINIDLTDDEYLSEEDIEGIWSSDNDPTNQISNPGDSVINLGEVYDYLYQNNPRFGCGSYTYDYTVENRAALADCSDKVSNVVFTFFEYIRPFTENNLNNEFCSDGTQPNSINLYDYLDFTTENGVLYDYPNENGTNWELISGPSTLGLQSNTGGLGSSNNWNEAFVLDSGYTTAYRTPGAISLINAAPGTYVFRYSVLPTYNCGEIPDMCTNSVTSCIHPCDPETADVTIIINPKNYAGEDTIDLQFCETSITAPIDLFSLLNTNGIDDPIYMGPLGNWVDLSTGNTITSLFAVPEINDNQTFNFSHNTTTDKNCIDIANLTFTVYEQYQSGTGSSLSRCNDDTPFNLFDILTGDINNNGTWTGPNGFTSTDNNAMFDPATFDPGDYTYIVPDNVSIIDPSVVMCAGNQAMISVTILQNLSAGNNVQEPVCKSDLQVDLTDFLDEADSGGTFDDIDNTNSLTGSIVNISQFDAGDDYSFQYQIRGNAICSLSRAIITLTILEAEPPTAVNQTFCLTDLATVSDLEASNSMSYMWYDTNTSTIVLAPDTLLANGEDYYVSGIDAINGCESFRTMIQVTLLPITHDDCDCIINDGISDNDDSENENLDLCNLPEVFPNYELEVFNRYGTIVFKGDNNTGLFEGKSNVSPTIGNKLPTGIYFYVFNPKNGDTAPFQGNVYLSR